MYIYISDISCHHGNRYQIYPVAMVKGGIFETYPVIMVTELLHKFTYNLTNEHGLIING